MKDQTLRSEEAIHGPSELPSRLLQESQAIQRAEEIDLKLEVLDVQRGTNPSYFMIDRLRALTDQDFLQQLSVSDEFQGALPKLALVNLQEHLDELHDTRVSSSVSLNDLKAYMSKDSGNPVETAMLQYVVDHFDKIREQDPHQEGITETAVKKSFSRYFELSSAPRANGFEPVRSLTSDLNYLNKQFDAIHTQKKFDGISKYELSQYELGLNLNQTDDRARVESILRHFEDLRALNNASDSVFDFLQARPDAITLKNLQAGLGQIAALNAQRIKADSELAEWRAKPAAPNQ